MKIYKKKIRSELNCFVERYSMFLDLDCNSTRFACMRGHNLNDYTIDFHYVCNSISLRDYIFLNRYNPNLLIHKIGSIGHFLRNLHSITPRKHWALWQAPRYIFWSHAYDWLDSKKGVTLHGDFGFGNILIDEFNDNIVIDPCADGYSTYFDNIIGPHELDVAKMIVCLLGKYPALKFISYSRNLSLMLILEFLKSYYNGDFHLILKNIAPIRLFVFSIIDSYVVDKSPLYIAGGFILKRRFLHIERYILNFIREEQL